MYNSQDLQKVLELREAILGGNEKRLKQQRDAGKLTARERIAKIADDGSFVELFALVSQNQEGAGVVTGSNSNVGLNYVSTSSVPSNSWLFSLEYDSNHKQKCFEL